MTTIPSDRAGIPTDPRSATDSRTVRRSSAMLLLGAILIPIAGEIHPTPDTELDWDSSIAGMLEDGAWYPAHILEFAGVALVAAALWQISRTPLVRGLGILRLAVIATAVGTSIHVIDLLPHTFAATQVDDLRAGDGSSLLDAHLVLQALATPVLGIAVVALALLDARRSPRWTWAPAMLGVIGGLVGAVAGPALLLTEDTSYAALFVGYAGIGIWLLVTAIRRALAVRGSVEVALT